MWYKPGSSSCGLLTVVVESAFLLTLEQEDPRIEDYGFTRVDTPSLGSCPFSSPPAPNCFHS